ncbi:hypothetical protein FFT09_06655 [Saccharomonospora piscinae]|uniref:hypothetical protein n=1 Tax=Saccharomonospora piscinae TaxID=687388 RepID=UPI001106FF59|nr:hypothetical protein [Saccharomonospora piscinae]TLW93105.1 hypothetical protein FFT09_06655 [Saccharomonospora piscinae]
MGATTRFDAVSRELYGAAPGEFVALREWHVGEARRRGEPELADRIHRLRKPTTAAALVNALSRHQEAEVAALVELGERLRGAHRDLAGGRLRDLTHERNERVGALVEHALRLADGRVGEPVRREIAATLEAAVGDEEAARAVIEGNLTTALRPPDLFDAAWLPSRSAPARRKSGQAARREAERRARAARDEARDAVRRAEREEAEARRRTEAARAALDEAERDLSRLSR